MQWRWSLGYEFFTDACNRMHWWSVLCTLYIVHVASVCVYAYVYVWYVFTLFRWWPREKTALISFQLLSRTSFPRIQRCVCTILCLSFPYQCLCLSILPSLPPSSLLFMLSLHFLIVLVCAWVLLSILIVCLWTWVTVLDNPLFETISLPISTLIVYREYHVMQCAHKSHV